MSLIPKKFLTYSTVTAFQSDLGAGNISDKSIVFVTESGKEFIYAQGTYFYGSFSKADGDALEAAISTQGSTISGIQSAITTVTGNVASLTTRVSTAENTLSTATSNISTLQSQMTTANNNIASLQTAATTAASEISDIEVELGKVKQRIPTSAYCVGTWPAAVGSTQANATSIDGDRSFALAWYPWLIDTTDNANVTTRPVGQLKKNNWFRFKDGSFAPVVGITEAQRSACDVALYLDAAHTNMYCKAGEFDAAKFYNTYGMGTPLYNSSGASVRILRPWETAETKYTIGVGRKETVYLVDNIGTSSGLKKGIYGDNQLFDEFKDISQFALAPTAISPGPATTIGNSNSSGSGNAKMRNFFYTYQPSGSSDNAKGLSGLGVFSNVLPSNSRMFPRSIDVNQVTNMYMARNNNADVQKPYPFAEGGYHAYNTFLTCMEVGFGTKYLNSATMFSSGTSSNEGINNSATWLTNGGVRYRVTGSESWIYQSWSATPSNVYYDASGNKSNWSYMLTSYGAKWQSLEPQLFLSYAVEMNIAAGTSVTNFYADSNNTATYWYELPTAATVGGSTMSIISPLDGEMNARVYKRVDMTVQAYNSSGTAVNYDVQYILRAAITEGVDTSGDLWAYWGGGFEQIGTCTVDPGTNRTGNSISMYLQPDQTKWVWDTNTSKTGGGANPYECEDSYIKLTDNQVFKDNYIYATDVKNVVDHWTANDRIPYSPLTVTSTSGTASTGDCHYQWSYNYWGDLTNNYVRLLAIFRASASDGTCSSRAFFCAYSAAYTHTYIAGSAQALIDTVGF